MSIINDTLKVVALPTISLALSGSIGTAASTVDKASSFDVVATAANLAFTLPTPTDPQGGDRVVVTNDVGNANAYTVNGYPIAVGAFGQFIWSGTAWHTLSDSTVNGAVVTVATIAAGASAVTHNLALPAGSFNAVSFRAYNASGNEIVFRRDFAGDTANDVGLDSPVAIATPTTFYVTRLA